MAESNLLQQTRSTLVNAPGAPVFTTPEESVDALTVYQEKRAREAKTGAGQYFGAMWRQDSPVDGVMAEVVGSNMAPDPNYAPYAPDEWKQLTEGIPKEFHHSFYAATSPAHALYIRQRLQQKLDDLQKLGDLGVMGNAGRLALNFLEPTSLLAGVASGGVFKVASGMAAASRASRMARTLGDAEKAAGAVAAAAGREASTGAKAIAVAGGGAFNVGFEDVRQSVNFEDSSAALIEAGLLGMALSAPFFHLSSREMAKLSSVATQEHNTLGVLRKQAEGIPLEPADIKVLEAQQALSKSTALMIYRSPEDQLADMQLAARTNPAGPTVFVGADGTASMSLPAREWLEDFRAELRADTEKRLAEMFPNRGKEEPVRVHRLSPEEKAKLEARVAREDEAWALKKLNAERDAQGSSQKVTLKELAGGPEVRNPVLDPAKAEAIKARPRRQAEWDLAMGQMAARKTAELDKMWIDGHLAKGERDLAMDQLQEDIRAAKAQFLAEQNARPEAPSQEPVPGKIEGTDVLWRDDGRPETGQVVQEMPNGKLKIDLYPSLPGTGLKTPGGNARFKYLHRSELDPDSPLYRDETPEGFGPGSVGAAQAGQTNVQSLGITDELYDKNTASPHFDDLTAFSKFRLDLFARLNKSENPGVKYLGNLLVRDAIGNSKEYAQRWTASERKRNWQRTLGGHFHKEAREAFAEVRQIRHMSLIQAEQGGAKDFYEMVSKVTRMDQEVLRANADIAPQLQRAAKAMRDTFAAMAELAQKSGLEGAENLTPDAAYVNRVWNHDRIREMRITHGPDAVIEVLAGSINQRMVERFKKSPRYHEMKAAGKGTDMDIRKAKAKSFLEAVERLEFSPAIQDIHLMAGDMKTLRETLRKEGLSDDHIDNIVDVMFEAKEGNTDAGNPTNLRFRFDLDENHSLDTPAGKLKVSDLLENDSRLLTDIYLNSMAGHTALAEKGITSRAAFQKELDAARQWYADNQQATKGAGRINEEIQMLDDIYSNLTGRPMSMQNFNKADRIAGALRAYARASFLGQLGVASAFELINSMALTGIRAFAQQSGGFRGFIQAVRTGKVPNRELSQQIEMWTGFGQEAAMSYARQHEITDFSYDKGLNRFENFGNKASHAVDIISGNRHFTSMTRQMSAASFIQKHVNMAGKKISAKQRWRLVNQGVDDAQIETVLSGLKQHSTLGNNGRVLEIDWEGWKKDDPKAADTYLLVLNREVRDAIQEHDLGELPMFMHNTYGRIFGELRTFMAASHAKQFLKGITYMDSTTLNLWMFSFVGQAMAYSLQQSINFSHNQAELDKRLSLDRIATAAVQRMSVTGVMPALAETGWYTLTGGSSLFQPGGTTNTDNRNLLMTPSGMMITRAMKGVSVGVGALNPFTDNIVTKQDVKDSLAPLPGANTYLLRNMIDMLSNQFPKSEVSQ